VSRGLRLSDDGSFIGRCDEARRLLIMGSMGTYDGPIAFYEWEVLVQRDGQIIAGPRIERTSELSYSMGQLRCDILFTFRARAVVRESGQIFGEFSEPIRVFLMIPPTHTPTPTPSVLIAVPDLRVEPVVTLTPEPRGPGSIRLPSTVTPEVVPVP
jgi:hypothetical protein